MPIAAVINGEQFAVHSDHLNTPRRMTDKDGKARWQWAYSGFGEVSAQSLTTDSLPERRLNLRYAGQVDDGNGLFYNWHRFYHPATGRYTQSDPIGLAGGLNRFGYVGGNALDNVDPEGLLCNWTQGTGSYSCYDPSGNYYASGTGYAGAGVDKNNPASQNIFKKGPLPKGCYKVSGIENGSTGPYSLRLTPLFKNDASNSNRELGSFLIHGDSVMNPGTASEGCPIMQSADRRKIPLGEVFCVN